MKPFAIYGKKPRGSKTSKRDIIEGIPVFLHYSTGSTKGNLVVYHDAKPYPRICVAAGITYWDCRKKVEKFFSKNSLDIKHELEILDKNYGVPFEAIDKINSGNKYEYDIYTENNGDIGLRLITPYVNGEYLYLYADPLFAPVKNIGGKKLLDVDLICAEYLRRLDEQKHLQ